MITPFRRVYQYDFYDLGISAKNNIYICKNNELWWGVQGPGKMSYEDKIVDW